MSDTRAHVAVVTAEGHLVDSQLLASIFDRIIERGGAFEVEHFELGRTNDDFSKLTLKVSAPTAAGQRRMVRCARLSGGCQATAASSASTWVRAACASSTRRRFPSGCAQTRTSISAGSSTGRTKRASSW